MAGPTLGTLLIQRLDAALGTTLSQQSSIVNRSISDAVAQPGQTDRLEPISNTLVRHPRETVDRLLSGAGSGPRVDAQKTSRGTGTTGQALLTGQTTSATTTLGPAARIILALFSNQAATSLPVSGRAPLLNTAPGTDANVPAGRSETVRTIPGPQIAAATQTSAHDTHQLAQTLTRALTQTLQQSGLFYESHLKLMTQGQYRVTDLVKEPQAHAASRPSAGSPASSSASQSALSLPGANTPGVDPATHTIVRHQLEALADQSIHWRGDVWPGTEMDWHVHRHHEPPHDASSGTTDDDTAWQSRIRLQLPELGDITADIQLSGNQISLTLQANDTTSPILRQHASALHRQMSDRQLELTALTLIDPDSSES